MEVEALEKLNRLNHFSCFCCLSKASAIAKGFVIIYGVVAAAMIADISELEIGPMVLASSLVFGTDCAINRLDNYLAHKFNLTYIAETKTVQLELYGP